MTEKTRLSLGGVWLIASLSALLLPVFIPSYPHGAGFFSNIIETSFGTMFSFRFRAALSVFLCYSQQTEFWASTQARSRGCTRI